MLRTALTFAAGVVVAGFVLKSGSARKFREVAKDKATRLKAATRKAAAAAREEWHGEAGTKAEVKG